MRRFLARYPEVRYTIATGDVLLFSGRGIVSCLIGRAGRSVWSHAGMADWRDDVPDPWRLECLESREWCGCRAVPLSHLVAQYPGRIDVFRVSPAFGDLDQWDATAAATWPSGPKTCACERCRNAQAERDGRPGA